MPNRPCLFPLCAPPHKNSPAGLRNPQDCRQGFVQSNDAALAGGRLRHNILRLLAFEAVADFIRHFLPFMQRLVALLLNSGKVDKQVFALAGFNKSVALCVAEPLDFSDSHGRAFLRLLRVSILTCP